MSDTGAPRERGREEREREHEGRGYEAGRTGSPGFDWENAEDLTALSGEDLARRLEELAEEERAAGYRQRVLRGRMDLVRAELLRRDGFALSPEELADVILGRYPAAPATGACPRRGGRR